MAGLRSAHGLEDPVYQPHIGVAVSQLGGGSGKSGAAAPLLGHMMIDTGAAVTLVTKAWAEAHGLRINSAVEVPIRGASGTEVTTVGTTSMTIQLAPTLELDVTDVAVSEGDFYEALLGCDVLKGKRGVLGPATITMSTGKGGGI